MSKELETFKKKYEESRAQLSQALELNEKLIHETTNQDKQISQFKSQTQQLKNALEEKNQEIQQLHNQITQFKQQKVNNKITTLADKWIQKHDISRDRKPEVVEMLSKFKEEGELSKVEAFLGLDNGKKVNAKPLTQSSTVVAEKFSNPQKTYTQLSREEKMDMLYQKLASIHKDTR